MEWNGTNYQDGQIDDSIDSFRSKVNRIKAGMPMKIIYVTCYQEEEEKYGGNRAVATRDSNDTESIKYM